MLLSFYFCNLEIEFYKSFIEPVPKGTLNLFPRHTIMHAQEQVTVAKNALPYFKQSIKKWL